MSDFNEPNNYPVSITGRHLLITDAMKEYAKDKLIKLEHLSHEIQDVHITMDIQKQEHRVDAMLSAGRFVVKTHASSPDMYASIDKVVDKLMARLGKYKSKMQMHHAKALSVVDIEVNVIKSGFNDDTNAVNDAIDEANRLAIEEEFSHHIVSRETQPLKTLSQDEAVMKMDLSGEPLMIYRSEEDQKIKIIQRRTDGHYGLVSPE